jgi:hypothetical protein
MTMLTLYRFHSYNGDSADRVLVWDSSNFTDTEILVVLLPVGDEYNDTYILTPTERRANVKIVRNVDTRRAIGTLSIVPLEGLGVPVNLPSSTLRD